jgi:DNA mismatch repair protein MutS2
VAFELGEEVVVVPLNRRGRVVGVKGSRYRIAVGALTVSATLDEIRPAGARGPKRVPRQPVHRDDHTHSRRTSDPSTRRIDLHGMTVEQAREAVLSAVNAAALAGDDLLEVIHGIGTGRVRAAVWRELKRLSIVRHVTAHPTNRGITLVGL